MLTRGLLAATIAARSLRASPWSTVAAVVVLAGAVGAHRSVATAWSSIVHPDLPYRDAEEFVQLEVRGGSASAPGIALLFQREIETLTHEGQSFVWAGHSIPARIALGSRMVVAASVEPGLFDSLGVAPAVGRLFRPEDHAAGAPAAGAGARDVATPVVVLAYDLAASIAGDARAAVGTDVELDGREVRIVGVMPEGFFFPSPQIEAWLPEPENRPQRTSGSTRRAAPTFARLRPGVAPSAAAAEATALLHAADQRPEDQRVVATPVAEALTRPVRPTLDVLRAGAILLLLAAGASVAALRLSRAEAERRGAAIRRSLGASPADEWAVAAARIALLAGVVGAASWFVSRGLLPLLEPFARGFPLAGRSDAVSMVGSLATPLLAAALAELPAAVGGHRDPGRDSGSRRSGTRGMLLYAGGAATAVVMLIATVALALSARSLLDGTEGYPSAGLAEITVDFEGREFVQDQAERTRILEDLSRRIEARPDVVGAAWADRMPDDPSARFVTVTPLDGGRAAPFAGDESLRLRTRSVGPGFLALLEIPVLDGRGLLPSDDPPAPRVVLADRPASLAASGSESALGGLLDLGASRPRVVGMVPAIATFPSGRAHPTIYQPYAVPPLLTTDRSAVTAVRFRETPDTDALAALSGIVSRADPSLRTLRVESVRDRRLRILGAPAVAAAVLAVFALCGILMAIAGAVGQVSDHAARASRDLAIRKALGASTDEIVWESIRRAVTAAAVAMLAGGLAGWFLVRFIASRVPWVKATDPFLVIGPAAFVALCLLLAGLVTGIRASRAAPWPRLRTE